MFGIPRQSIFVAWVIASLGCFQFVRGQGLPQQNLVFPLYVEMSAKVTPQFVTQIDTVDAAFEIVNPNASSAAVTFRAFDPSGNEVFPQSGILLSVTVPPNGALRNVGSFVLVFPRNNFVGWVSISSSQPVIVQEQFIHYLTCCTGILGPPTTEFKSQFAKAPSPPARKGMVKVVHSSLGLRTETVIVIVFPNTNKDSSAKGSLVLRADNGTVIVQREISVAANNQVIRTFSDLFSDVFFNPPPFFTESFSGTLEFNFDNEVVFTGLKMTTGFPVEMVEESTLGILQ